MKKLIVFILLISCSTYHSETDVFTKYATGCHTLAGCVEVLAEQGRADCAERNAKFRMVDKGWEYRKVYMKYRCI